MAADKYLPTQGRDAPAYQEFAASMMARLEYREMNLAERGLLYTLRNECWVNHRMPSEPARLARVLNVSVDDIRSLLPAVMSFFEVQGDSLICPELENYRHYQDARRERMSEGGKRSAEKRKHTKHDVDEVGKHPTSTLQAASKPSPTSLQALSPVKSKQDKSKPVASESNDHEAWIRGYEHAETNAGDYACASRGG